MLVSELLDDIISDAHTVKHDFSEEGVILITISLPETTGRMAVTEESFYGDYNLCMGRIEKKYRSYLWEYLFKKARYFLTNDDVACFNKLISEHCNADVQRLFIDWLTQVQDIKE